MIKKYFRDKKIVKEAEAVILEALQKYGDKNIALAWTGGKDSTLLLWLTKNVCQRENLPLPAIVFIDEGDLFSEIIKFSKKLIEDWDLKVDFTQNEDVMKQVKKIGDKVIVKKLAKYNQDEIKKLELDIKSFKFEPESLVGNQLMKTVALNRYLEKNKVGALITGIRKDEQEARSQETYFSERKSPKHTRVHPILDFLEEDVWNVTHRFKVPFSKLYNDGYRSLGAKSSTKKPSSVPAWQQDMEKTTERAGRRQDKEQIMAKLRKLGYM